MQLELKRLQHEVGITFVVVTHDQEEAMSMADRIAVMQLGEVEQVDAPVALYERPRSLFVARFIGSNDIFRGRATAGGVDVPGVGELRGTPSGVEPGSEAYLAVRPEHVKMVPGDEAVLRGQVADIQFYGGVSTLAVDVHGYEHPVMVTQQGVADVARGTEVGLTWDPGRAVILGG
jgi:spermidine/putrescine transport system ATP-binding protein/putrescine transport system ATP-binding protein